MIGEEFLATMIRRVKYYKQLGDKTFVQLSDVDFHYRTNNDCNSIAMIVQHMAGNMLSRWTNFLTEDGEKPWRQRDEEFMPHQQTRVEIIQLWEKGWKCYIDTLTSLTSDDLLKTVYIREEGLTVIDALNRQLAHYPYHVGQIVQIAKELKSNNWQTLSIPIGGSAAYNASDGNRDPAKKFK